MHHQIRPTTLVGIKRLARQINAAEGIQHALALDKASEVAGFPNFRAAQRALAAAQADSFLSFPLFLTEYWKDRKEGSSGRETLELRLSRPWHELIDPRKLGIHRATSGLAVVAPDHLEMRHQTESQSQARRSMCAAARLFEFMQATGLRPASGVRAWQRVFTDRELTDKVPGRDHESLWFHPELERYVYAIEPYRNPDFLGELSAWAKPRGIDVVTANWGLYAPDSRATLFLLSEAGRGVPLPPIVEALRRLAPPLVEAAWNGVSAPVRPFFTSPRHGEPSLLNAARRARTGPVKKRGKRQMHWGRKLLILGVNELLQRGLISQSSTAKPYGFCEAQISDRHAIVQWRDIGHEELRISVWWGYDHACHPQADQEGFGASNPLARRSSYRRFVAAMVSGWLERSTGLALQGRGRRALMDLYLRTDSREAVAEIPTPEAAGFQIEGPVY